MPAVVEILPAAVVAAVKPEVLEIPCSQYSARLPISFVPTCVVAVDAVGAVVVVVVVATLREGCL